jgi:hypothetical protein
MFIEDEEIEPGLAVFRDDTANAVRLLWLPDALAPWRVFTGFSMRDRVPIRQGKVRVQGRGSFPSEGASLNVHAASAGEAVDWRGMLTTSSPSSEVGAEILALPLRNVSFHEPSQTAGWWSVNVNLP